MNHPVHSTDTVNRHLLRRLCTFVFGLFLASISTCLSITAGLGLSAFNSTCSVMGQQLHLSIGDCTILLNCFMFLVQWVLLGRHFQLFNVVQVPFSILYGKFVVLISSFLPEVTFTAWYQPFGLLLVSMVLMAVGVLAYVGTELVPMPVEGAALVISAKTHLAFHHVKILLDVAYLLTAIGGALYFYGNLGGVGVGTVLLAFGTGWTMGIIKPWLPRWVQNWHLE